jgi:hypothetical protein
VLNLFQFDFVLSSDMTLYNLHAMSLTPKFVQVLSVCYENDISNCASIADVIFGDVFLCSGQSNMAYGMGATHGEREDWREHLRFDAPDFPAMKTSSSSWTNEELPGIRLVSIAREIGGELDTTTSLNVSFTTPSYACPLSPPHNFQSHVDLQVRLDPR